ncbi:MAG: ABC transporter ATP-binding protein [Phycisphaerales bacterium]|nr:ABC transporter ATP-binding protein [Phycisphaerales bacterium]|tara:strand:+ start:4354 stop:5322 length:969 start_codon:yes stop_codon:yes gene_type:complete
MAATAVISVNDVHKTFKRRVHALRGVSMRVNEGEVFGLLGPNGAGKSTLVKILMTVIKPTRLQGSILGKPVGHKPTLRHVGYLPEHHRFPKHLRAGEVLDYFASLSGVPRKVRRKRVDEMLELVGMQDWKKQRVGEFSKGMQQRIGIAQALMNDPRILMLDEPTDGVDPVGRREIRDLLIRLRDEGRTIFINSHLLSELEMVCNRVAIMVKGQVSMEGTIDDLTSDSRRYEIVVQDDLPPALEESLGTGVTILESDRSRLVLPNADSLQVQPIIDRLRSGGVIIESVQPVRESLEELFMRAVNSTGEDAATPGAVKGKVAKP